MIRLRSLEEADLSQLRDWRNDDRLRHCFRDSRLLNMLNQKDWFGHVLHSSEVEMFGIEVDGTLIGACGLCNINWVNRTAEVSLYVDPKYQPSEREALELLMRKAFKEFNLRRLWAETYELHEAHIKLLEEAGFQLEGRLREHVFKLGKYWDSLIHGRTR